MTRLARNTLVVASIGVYFVAFVLPTASPIRASIEIGWEVFAESFRVLVFRFSPADPYWWLFSIPWLANPFYWASVVSLFHEKEKLCRCFAFASLCTAILGGVVYWSILVWHPGYWAWMGAILMFFFVSFSKEGFTIAEDSQASTGQHSEAIQ